MRLYRLGAALLLGTAFALSACSVGVESDGAPKSDTDAPAESAAPDTDSSAGASGAPAPGVPRNPVIPTAGDDVHVVNGNGANDTLACAGKHIVVNGNDNVLTYTGQCSSVTVNGNDNKISVDTALAVIFNGGRNALTYKQGSPNVLDNDGSNNAEAA
jgi:Protein of unknown function (DUF3060)